MCAKPIKLRTAQPLPSTFTAHNSKAHVLLTVAQPFHFWTLARACGLHADLHASLLVLGSLMVSALSRAI